MSKARAPLDKRMVWRISPDAPLGEWVDSESTPAPGRARTPKAAPAEVQWGNYLMSSFDLLSGADVCELPDTTPGDLIDGLFNPKDTTPRTTGR
jgi:hypothetical protein